MIAKHWKLQDAKNQFSALVDRAENDGPQVVTRYGKDTVVVLSVDDYKKLTKPKTTLVKFLQNSPLSKEDLDLSRSKELPRELDL